MSATIIETIRSIKTIGVEHYQAFRETGARRKVEGKSQALSNLQLLSRIA